MRQIKALLVDPEKGSVEQIEFDGEAQSAMRLLGCDELDRETYPAIEVLRNAATVDKSSVHGFVLERTGGAVHHGKCLIVGRGYRNLFTDVGLVKFKFRFIPGYGVQEWK